MVEMGVQELIAGFLVHVRLPAGKTEVSVVIKRPEGTTSQPQWVSLEPFLQFGMCERKAISEVLKIVRVTLQSARSAIS
ncbi:hypothetical protein B0G80_0370 [Paraburkholderia sp. BL6669N2]|nr:hypothetical protein B0G80_0370 [Paraburkholderia sp. BL6669N2]